jgi:hypothetical protein
VRCQQCGRQFREGDEVVPVLRYVTNEKRGDWVSSQGHRFIHAHHVGELPGPIG